MARTASLELLLGLVVGKGEEHVDVGVGEEILAAVAAQGQQGDVLRGLAGEGPAPHFNQDTVHDGGAAADGGGAVAGALAGLADERHLPRILLPKIVNRQSDWIHKVFVCGLPKQEGIVNSISEIGADVNFWFQGAGGKQGLGTRD